MAKATNTEADAPPEEPTFEEQKQQEAESQSQTEAQVVPEQRPQAFVGGIQASDASKRLDKTEPMGEEAYEAASSEKQIKAAEKDSRTEHLIEGQRVTFIDGPEQGRMGFVQSVVYTDPIQQMVASAGISEGRFAQVDHYIVRTRDGRADLLEVPPGDIKPLDDTQGWGRGQI